MKSLYILSTLMLSSLSGCITMSNLPRTEAGPTSSDETIVVLGVQPRYRVALSKGTANGESWSLDQLSLATTNSFPENGYIVVKVPSRTGSDTYGISQILPEGIGGFVPRYVPCNGQGIITFDAPAGKVVYVGDIEYARDGDKLRYIYSSNPEQARRFVAEQYPALSTRLELHKANVSLVKNIPCGPTTIYLPITVKAN
jgi:hypothetical protein